MPQHSGQTRQLRWVAEIPWFARFYTHQRWLAAWTVSYPQHTCYCHLGLYLATNSSRASLWKPKTLKRNSSSKKTSISRGFCMFCCLEILNSGRFMMVLCMQIRPTLWIAVFFCHGVAKRWKFQHFGLSRAKKHRKQHCWSSYLKKTSNRFSLV